MTDILIPKLSMSWRIRIRFGDGLPPYEFISNDVRRKNPRWHDETFGRKIESLEFFIPTGDRIILKGMEQYNFFVEVLDDLKGGKASIAAFYFLGKLPNTNVVEIWKVGNGKGDGRFITRNRKLFGQEWGGTPTRGWKDGIIGNPISTLAKGH